MLKFIRLLPAILALFAIGCAGIEPPSPSRVLPPWSDVYPSKLGESKASIRSTWGEPDEVKEIGVDDVGLRKEVWIYYNRSGMMPLDTNNVKRLIFTGDALTGYENNEGEIRDEQ